jgi:hypothetical protein
MDMDEVRKVLRGVKSKIRITKVVCTRSVKGRGDTFAGFSAAWDSVQEDGMQGMDEEDPVPTDAMTLQESIIASHIIAREANLAAYAHALAGGTINSEMYRQHVEAIKANFNKLIVSAITGTAESPNETNPTLPPHK